MLENALDLEAIDDLAADQIGFDDFIDIAEIDVGVPRATWINDHDGTFIAAVETACFVDADFAFAIQVERLDAFLGVLLRVFCAVIGTTRAAIVPFVHAKEHVFFVILGI